MAIEARWRPAFADATLRSIATKHEGYGVARWLMAKPYGARSEALPPSRHGKAPLRRDDSRRSTVAEVYLPPAAPQATKATAWQDG